MNNPTIAEKSPAILELEAGTYWWCQYGLSKNQPFCDGSHGTTSFTPLEFTLEEKKKVALCRCKQTNKAPYCDGTHKNL
ncbi:MAG: CDGSH iron-sulfur domain-containing protein [Ignavibacteria bacterium]|nr:CDGSH iron-sulfur domain-containing protein [Ignavibacteria bacterium]